MENADYSIILDVTDMSAPVSLNVKQGDAGRVISVNLARDGVPVGIEPGSYAVFAGKKPDEKILWNSCSIRDSTIFYEITKQTTAVVGWVPVQIRLYRPGGKLVSSPDFVLIVDGTVTDDEEVVIVSENEVTALTELVSEAADAIEHALNVEGKSAYQVAQEAGFEGTVEEWLDSLVGPEGDPGPQGPQGDPGPQGPQGVPGKEGGSTTITLKYGVSSTPSMNTITGWKDTIPQMSETYPYLWIEISTETTTATGGSSTVEAGIIGYYSVPNSGGNVDCVGVEPSDDDIPKVFFGGTLQQTKDEKVVSFRYISKTEDISGYAEIKAQGNSSMNYPKKNQTVKLLKDADCTEKLKVDFKGWGKQNKHVYKANWIDLTHARNVVSARLWADIVKSRSNYEELPELLRTSPNQGAVDGFPVKVYADGVYQGRYTLNIPKDKWAFNMDDELDNHCVLCGENYVSGCFRASANINGSDWSDEIHDAVPASIKTRWNEVISFVMNSTDEEFRANLGNYFDIPSLIDYHLFGLASCGLDAYGKNQLYMTYDGQKWIASMYDMDSTWGLYWNGSKFVPSSYTREEYEDMISDREGNLLYIRLEQLFHEELQTRWAEMKNGALSIANIINRFERFTDIASAELVNEDYASTTGGGKFTGIPSQTTNNIQQIRSFALARQAWTDEYIANLTASEPEEPDEPDTEIPCTGITLDKSELAFVGEGTQNIQATVTPDGCTDPITWESDNTSVATVSGGAVTAIANGSATITAKCGNYSASCAVTVSGIVDETQIAYEDAGWITGEEYNITSGTVTAVNGCYRTGKFGVSANGRYAFAGTGTSDRKIHIWDRADNYIGAIKSFNDLLLKAGYKYAISVYNTAGFDHTTATFARKTVEAGATITIDLGALAWVKNSHNEVEADVTSYGIDLAKLATSNMFFNVGLGHYSSNPGNELFVQIWSNTTLILSKFINVDDATAYFAENPTTLIFNQ